MIVGKPGSHKRALRRHHDKCKKTWVHKPLGHYFMYATDPRERRVGMLCQRCVLVLCAVTQDASTKNRASRNAMQCLNLIVAAKNSPLPISGQAGFG